MADHLRAPLQYLQGRPEGHPITAYTQVNDVIEFKIAGEPGALYARVREVRRYTTYLEMLTDVGVKPMLPRFTGSVDEAADKYRNEYTMPRYKYSTTGREKGAVALRVTPLAGPGALA